ncbi:DNRLRE domain-containing protein [Streptacidiphilus cavernicola]|uniref:DNRLRE domain-containing protein n=1 Tax=Streptacidiphilus cavernicola TaxID=3342716 RepID=A0ABV6VR70_9ACTN
MINPGSAHADTSSPPVVTDPEAVASAQAQSTGKDVAVDADSTTTSTTVANPDGSFTYTASPFPVQVKQGGSWVPVDATLQHNADGTLSPKAAESQVSFSAGGGTALATLTNSQGQRVSLSWPNALPAVQVSGATATYPSVFPGVDLQMTATTDGGYSEELIVKTAAAAANPALNDIRFNTSTSAGLTLGRNAAGGLQVTDASGATAFTSPTATMWSTPDSGAAAKGLSTRSLGASTPDAGTAGTESTGDMPAQDDAGSVTDLAVNVSGQAVDLVPPAGALTSSSNTYPLVIDPSLSPAEPGWTWIASNTPGTSYWEGSNNTHDSYAHVGYDDWCADGTSGCSAFGTTRSLFSLSMAGLAGKHVTAASLSVTEQGPTSSWSGTRQIDLHSGGAFNSSTTWSNQSVSAAVSASANFATIASATTGNANFDVTSLIQSAVAAGYGTQTMALEAHDEGDDTAYRYLHGAVQLGVTYWSTPNLPTSLTTTDGGTTTSCNTTAPGTWISRTDSNTINLNASLTGPDSTYAETADYWYRKVQPALDASWTEAPPQSVVAQSTPQPTSFTMPTLTDGSEYEWQVYAQSDGGAYSSTAAPSAGTQCWFRTDFTTPTITPGTPVLPTGTGGTGSLPVTPTDPGTNPSGVTKILYNVNGTSLNSGGSGELSEDAGTKSVPLKADHWGTNTVWYAVVDAAGNQSAPQHYDYYVADSAFTPGTAGDLDGDHKPDLATVDSSGAVRYYSNPFAASPNGTAGNPDGGAVLIPASSAPNGTSFAGALIAHRGSYTEQTCDDLVVIQSGTLHVDTDNNNCSPTTSWTLGSGQARPTGSNVTGDTTNYNTTDWSSVRQAVLLSSSGGESALLTLENDNGVWTLWMFTANGPTFRKAVLLSTSSSWSHVTLISPGSINGVPALWARDTTTGSLTQYTGVEDWQNTTTPAGTTIAAGGYRVGQYPSITSDGPEDGTNPTLWATTRTGQLTEIPTTVAANGAVTLGAPVPVSSVGWAANVQTLDGVTPRQPTSSIGLYRPSTYSFIFDTSNSSTTVDHTLAYGNVGDIPVTGDWNGDGVDTVGVYRPSTQTFYLDDSNTVSETDHTIRIGTTGDLPVVGDWNGDGVDTVGVYRPSNRHFYLDDSLTSSNVDHIVTFGNAGDQPVVGDWNGDGVDTVGVYRPGNETFYLADSLANPAADHTLAFGNSGDTPLTGDWNGDGTDTVGVWRPSSFYLDNSLTVASIDQTTAFGIGTDVPLSGDWNGQ